MYPTQLKHNSILTLSIKCVSSFPKSADRADGLFMLTLVIRILCPLSILMSNLLFINSTKPGIYLCSKIKLFCVLQCQYCEDFFSLWRQFTRKQQKMSTLAEISGSTTVSDSGLNQDVELHFNVRAYSKMILHAAKYPHCAINGVLLAKSDKRNARYRSKQFL